MKIGISERGDASLDYSWIQTILNSKTTQSPINGVILITKNITDKFIHTIQENKLHTQFIIHATCTGFGGTKIEPNVPKYNEQIINAFRLANKIGSDRLVIRIDPIIPTKKGINTVLNVLEYLDTMDSIREFRYSRIKRIRYSFIDMYSHVKERFASNKIPLPYDTFTAPSYMINSFMKAIEKYRDRFEFESCAEYNQDKIGCISKKDLDIMGLTYNDNNTSQQRKGCSCLACKTELLNNKKQCGHKCLYCYWK